jgi:hypothetical protein
VVPKPAVLTLSKCRTFQPLGNHLLDRLRELRPSSNQHASFGARVTRWFTAKSAGAAPGDNSGQPDTIAKQLKELAALGLLVSDTEMLDECAAEPGPKSVTTAITSIGIPTRDRTETLERAIQSHIENAKRYERRLAFTVLDSSTSEASRIRTREMLGTLCGMDGFECGYAGRAEVVNFARELAGVTDVAPSLINFALLGDAACPVSTGASRNALLLGSVGETCLQFDDDIFCRTVSVPDRKPGLALVSDEDPTQFWFFPDKETALASMNIVEEDIVATHESLLGNHLAHCVASDRACLDLDRFEARHDYLPRSGRGRVRISCAGVAGDSGIASTGYLFMAPSSRQRLLSEAEYHAAVTSRQVLRGADEATLSVGANFMSGNLGLDNRGLLPPFLPVQRGSDAVFSLVLRTCFPHALVCFLPVALLHDPPEHRTQRLEDLWVELRTLTFPSVVLQLTRSFTGDLRNVEEEEGMRRLGRHLVDLGSMPLADFEECLRMQVWKASGLPLCHIERSIQTADGTPAFMKQHQRKYLEVVRESIAHSDYIVPRDLAERHGQDRARQFSQQLVRRYGELLEAWPELVKGAKVLRARGVPLAECVVKPPTVSAGH